MIRNGTRFTLALVLIAVVALSACGGRSEVSASSCDEIVDETLALYQRLIDDVDAQFADLTVVAFLAADDLPSLESFERDADRIDEIAEDLGCTQSEISAEVAARLGDLHATSEVGRFIISALRSGGL